MTRPALRAALTWDEWPLWLRSDSSQLKSLGLLRVDICPPCGLQCAAAPSPWSGHLQMAIRIAALADCRNPSPDRGRLPPSDH